MARVIIADANDGTSKEDKVIVGPFGETGTKPKVNAELISLNGHDSGFLGRNGHETFQLFRKFRKDPSFHNPKFDFCKTACKPYDWVVCCILLAAHKTAPDAITLSSDGDEHDWAGHVLSMRDLFPDQVFEVPVTLTSAWREAEWEREQKENTEPNAFFG